jgi:hypothetical protein
VGQERTLRTQRDQPNCLTTLNPQEIDRRTIDAFILRQHSGEENKP